MKNIIGILLLVLLVSTITAKNKTTDRVVEARRNTIDSVWIEYSAKTVDGLNGFKKRKEPPKSQYGGWKTFRSEATGFFRVEKIADRWWIIDPEGYPFIHKAVVAFNPGKSEKQRQVFNTKYQGIDDWTEKDTKMLETYGINGVGAWTDVDVIRKMENPLAYTVIVSPMGAYKRNHIKNFGGKYLQAGWQGYRFDLVMVFDKEFDEYITESIESITKYKNDKHLLGYFTDNELPWVYDALDRHLTCLAKDEQGYIAAKEWFDNRKGKDVSVEDITDEDRSAFTAFYFDTYMKKVALALRKADPNHMYLGCRFNQDRNKQELTNPEIFKIAGKYMDIVSINHYRKWEPDQQMLNNWGEWAGRPFLITEWYTKSEDSGLPNNTGAGWLVHTQRDRGYFYQNFTIGLLQNKNCVGWHWFKYMDNDPDDLTTDPSNRDSNKGVVDRYFNPYLPLLEEMKQVNDNAYNLIQYFDNKK